MSHYADLRRNGASSLESLEDALRQIVREAIDEAPTAQPVIVGREKLRDILGIEERTLKTLIGKGLPRLKHGHLTFFELDRVYDWLREGST